MDPWKTKPFKLSKLIHNKRFQMFAFMIFLILLNFILKMNNKKFEFELLIGLVAGILTKDLIE